MSSKEKFYEELAAHFTQEEQDSIKEKCSSMEMELPAFYDSESFYKWISHNFNSERFGYNIVQRLLIVHILKIKKMIELLLLKSKLSITYYL